MNLFDIIPENFFKPFTSKHKKLYVDCLNLIYDSYKSEYSFGVEKNIIVMSLENYFDEYFKTEFQLDDCQEVFLDSRAKANAVLRELRKAGWIEEEQGSDLSFKINFLDYAVTFIESIRGVVKNQEMEYQSVLSSIYNTLLNDEAYIKPYEYVIKNVAEKTEELINGLKKLNTNIKKYIDRLTADKEPQQVIKEFFQYHDEIGSKAYHRIKTSDNISKFRTTIIVRLKEILKNREILDKAINGYMEIEETHSVDAAEEFLRNQITDIINSFVNYSVIIAEIEKKNKKYQQCAVERAKFLLANGINSEGKIKSILNLLARKFNDDLVFSLYDEEDFLLNVFKIFPQNFIDSNSLYTEPIRRKIEISPIENSANMITDEERKEYEKLLNEKFKNSFSKKNIIKFISDNLMSGQSIMASILPLKSKRDLIRIVFIRLYAYENSVYEICESNILITLNNFRFCDFEIRRR